MAYGFGILFHARSLSTVGLILDSWGNFPLSLSLSLQGGKSSYSLPSPQACHPGLPP